MEKFLFGHDLKLTEKLHWIGQAAPGDVLVIETHLFRRGKIFSAYYDTCRFFLFKGLPQSARRIITGNHWRYLLLAPSIRCQSILLPIADEKSIDFHLSCIETISGAEVRCISSNFADESQPDILIECYEIVK